MDNDKLNLFVKEIQSLIDIEAKYDKEVSEYNSEIKKYKDTNTSLETQIKNMIITHSAEIVMLQSKIDVLTKENTAKTSKSIWEGTQSKLKEKDDEIEQLKKDVEFYKRQNTINTVPNTNTVITTSTVKQVSEVSKPKKNKLIVKTEDSVHKEKIIVEQNNNSKKDTKKQIISNDLDDELERELLNS